MRQAGLGRVGVTDLKRLRIDKGTGARCSLLLWGAGLQLKQAPSTTKNVKDHCGQSASPSSWATLKGHHTAETPPTVAPAHRSTTKPRVELKFLLALAVGPTWSGSSSLCP